MNEKAFSSVDYVAQCLLDKKRTTALIDSINKRVKPGMTVIDCGTGSAILAIKAAQAGAKKVYAIEFDPYIANLAIHNIKLNGLDNIVEVLKGDARTIDPPTDEKIDVVIMEMLTTGMIEEFQIQTIQNLKNKKIVDDKTIYIPQRQQSFITLGHSSHEVYGIKIKMPLHLWEIHVNHRDFFEPITQKTVYDDYNFNTEDRGDIQMHFETIAEKDSVINSILFESVSILSDESLIDETSALNGKVLIPTEEIKVMKNDRIRGVISYKYGEGFNNLVFKFN